MQKITQTVSLLLFAIFLIPQISFAEAKVEQTTVRLGENIFLHTITYRFGFDKYETRIPIRALRNASFDDTSVVGYDILNGGLRTTVGATKAIVLSNAKVDGTEYVVPKGETAEFTLVSFLILPEDSIASTSNYALKISSLPFTMTSDQVEIQGYLNKSELRSFVTSHTSFKSY